MRIKLLISALALCSSLALSQVSKPIELPYYDYPMVQADHYEVITQHCLTCHSFGYVLNQGKKSRPYWTGVVRKMADEFKAPISKEDQQVVVNYLVKHYGDGK